MTEHRFTLDQQKDEREFRTGVETFLRANGIHLALSGNIPTLEALEDRINTSATTAGRIVQVQRSAFDRAIIVRIGDPQPTANAPAGHAGTEPTPPPASETCPHAQVQRWGQHGARCLHCGAVGFVDHATEKFMVLSPETSTRPAMTPEVAEMAGTMIGGMRAPRAKQSMNNDAHITLDKELRRDIDEIIQRLKKGSDKHFTGMRSPDAPVRASLERSLAITKLQEAVMWLGMDLKAINDESGGAENPYPNSKDPSNTVIDKTADGLKL